MVVEQDIASRLRRGTVEALALRVAGVSLGFLMNSVLGRFVGPGGYGVISYALALVSILSVVSSLGWQTALMRFLNQFKQQQLWGLLHGVVRRAYEITFISSVLVAVALWALSYQQPLPPDMRIGFRFAALLLPPLSLIKLCRKGLQGLQLVKLSIFPEDVALPLLVMGAMVAFSVAELSKAVLIFVSAAILICVVSSILLWHYLPINARLAPPTFRTREWGAVALAMVLGGLGQLVMNNTDVVMLGTLLDMKAVGVYSAANRIARFNTFGLVAANTMAVPLLAEVYHMPSGHQRLEQFRMIIQKAILWSTIIALPAFVSMFVFPERLLGLFGSSFVHGAAILRVLGAGQFINAITGPVGFALLMTGRERQFATSTAVVAGFNILGNLFAINTVGAIGAAWVTTASVALLNIWQLLLTYRVGREIHG